MHSNGRQAVAARVGGPRSPRHHRSDISARHAVFEQRRTPLMAASRSDGGLPARGQTACSGFDAVQAAPRIQPQKAPNRDECGKMSALLRLSDRWPELRCSHGALCIIIINVPVHSTCGSPFVLTITKCIDHTTRSATPPFSNVTTWDHSLAMSVRIPPT